MHPLAWRASARARKARSSIIHSRKFRKLRFMRTKCVQCGLCAVTCPEDAIALVPRLSLAPEAKQPQVVNEAVIFNCTRCGKPLGTEKMIGNMLTRLAGHSMFAEPGSLDAV